MARSNKNYEKQKNKLIITAFDLFIKNGYEKTTISQIMNKAGLTKAGLYHYFSSKEEILESAISYGIKKDIDELEKNMQRMSPEEKMLQIIKGNSIQNSLLRKMLQIQSDYDTSYASYRIQECLIHAYIPIMERILKEGVQQGVYKVEYPVPTAEFLVLLGKSLVEKNILPIRTLQHHKERTIAFLKLMESWIHPSEDHMKDIFKLFDQIIITKRDVGNDG